jgi:hypothetical protein
MRIIFGFCVAALLAVVACASETTADTCQAMGGSCVNGTVGCGETLPYDCGAANLSCCGKAK